MEKKNNSGMYVGIIIGLVIAVIVGVVLLLTGTIELKKSTSEDNRQNSINNQNNSNKEVDEYTKNMLFDIVGIPSANKEDGSIELNNFISNNNYKDNADNILRYAGAYVKSANVTLDIDECGPNCIAYAKEDAEKLIKIYNFPGTVDDYFVKSKAFENIYIKSLASGVLGEWNGQNAGIKHESIVCEYFDNDSVRITDKQIINKYSFDNGNGVLHTINQTTVFEFKKDNVTGYYLSSVIVK